jgi:hypothetical protein
MPTQVARRVTQIVRALAVAVLLVTISGHVIAAQPVFSLGSISLGAGHSRQLRGLLRAAITEELASADFAKLRSRSRYVISARLLDLRTTSKRASTVSTCAVSLVLRSQKGDELLAIVNGRGSAEEGGKRSRQTEAAALRAAVRGALRRVPSSFDKLSR